MGIQRSLLAGMTASTPAAASSADGVGVVAFVGEQCFDAVAEHSEQWAKALYVVRLAWRQDKTERSAMSVAAGVELGSEATARPAKPLSLFIPFF